MHRPLRLVRFIIETFSADFRADRRYIDYQVRPVRHSRADGTKLAISATGIRTPLSSATHAGRRSWRSDDWPLDAHVIRHPVPRAPAIHKQSCLNRSSGSRSNRVPLRGRCTEVPQPERSRLLARRGSAPAQKAGNPARGRRRRRTRQPPRGEKTMKNTAMCAMGAGVLFPAIAAHAGGADDIVNPVILVADAPLPVSGAEGFGAFGAAAAQSFAGGSTASGALAGTDSESDSSNLASDVSTVFAADDCVRCPGGTCIRGNGASHGGSGSSGASGGSSGSSGSSGSHGAGAATASTGGPSGGACLGRSGSAAAGGPGPNGSGGASGNSGGGKGGGGNNSGGNKGGGSNSGVAARATAVAAHTVDRLADLRADPQADPAVALVEASAVSEVDSQVDSARVDRRAARAAGTAAATVAAMAAVIDPVRRCRQAAAATPIWRDGQARQSWRRRRRSGPPAGARRRGQVAGYAARTAFGRGGLARCLLICRRRMP